jgi:hypothetical protein
VTVRGTAAAMSARKRPKLALAHHCMGNAPPWRRLASDAARFAAVPSKTEVLPLVIQWRELWQSH